MKTTQKLTRLAISAMIAAGLMAAPQAAQAATPVPSLGFTTVSCSAGNFRGEVDITWVTESERTTFSTGHYRITKLNGQQGGNKANINLTASSFEATYLGGWDIFSFTQKSPDAMIQDGSWHYQRMSAVAHLHPMIYPVARGSVEFIFDKSGSDPRCTVGFTA